MLFEIRRAFLFESSVNSIGTKTCFSFCPLSLAFESSVNSDGTKTMYDTHNLAELFESSMNADRTKPQRPSKDSEVV